MAREIVAPESISVPGYRVFLAGAIDMGAAVNWQQEVVTSFTSFSDELAFLNPRRAAFTPETLDEQIHWELDALERANTVFMWLPADAKAPVSMFEAGLYWRSGKLLIGAAPGFYRRRNLEITALWYGVTLFDDIQKQCRVLISKFVEWCSE